MAVHFFHCTDGVDLIVDRTGRDLKRGEAISRALSVAHDIKLAVPSYGPWSDWAVHVYDERGEVAIVPFESEIRQAA